MEDSTAPLRSAAPSWTLAGDKQLLDILQNIHQSLMTRCQEVNRRLDEMVNALDGASVDLQNVNNKFMALSNSQFIESRVYDDDVDVTKQEAPKEAPPPTSPPSDVTDLLAGVRTLQRCHEAVRICGDSDTSDSEEEITSVVFRPKDVYRRPLPLVIGTAAWRNKWHAGLLPEDSDSDSSTSKPEVPDEEYSDSEPEAPARERHENETHLTETDGLGSTTSSEIFSEQDIILPVKPSPSDVAAELARKLRGPAMLQEQDTFVPPQPTTNKVYRPEQPTTGTIFSDEPPPFEDDQSEADPYEEEEDDIFAELHKKPYAHSNKVQSSVADDLFGGLKDDRRGLFSDFVDNEILPPPVASQKTTLFEDESEPELFASKPTNKSTEKRDDSTTTVETVKKPIGGISLFGSNKGAESIGAAILKRNRRKSSSEEESQSEETKPPPKEEKSVRATEKDIFDDLFAKSEKEQKTKKETVNKVVKTDKIDLFSDNLFDDIDDIFTTDVKTVKVDKSNDKKSIFDDAEDDLFANIAVAESAKREVKSESQSKSVFDSDDDLFKVEPETKAKEIGESSKTIISKSNEASKSLFDDDSSDSDMFSKLSKNNVNPSTNSTKSEVSVSKASVETKSLNDIRNNVTNNNVESKTSIDKVKEKSPLLFDDDDNDSDDIFNNRNKNTSLNNTKSTGKTNLEEKENKPEMKSTKTSLFNDEEGDDLFTNLKKSTDEDNKFKNSPPVEVKVKTTNDYNIFNTTIKDADNKEKINDISDNNNTEKHGQDDVKNRIEASQNKTSIFDDDDNDTFFDEVRPSNDINTSIPKTIIDSSPSLTHLKHDKNEIKPSTKEKQQNEHKLHKNEKTLESKTEKVIKESIITEKSDKPNVDSSSKTIQEDNNSFFDTVKDVVFKTTGDIFADLIDEPPAFEKPKEPKKSKNVNALFDDDSDDEALFFKKNDITFDDKPNEEDDTNDPMFGIFHDEPPAIDVDFTAKSNKSSKSNQNSDEDIFKTIETSVKADDLEPYNNRNVGLDNEDELFKASVPTDFNNKSKTSQDVPKSLKDIDDFLNSDSDSDLFKTTKLPPKPVIASKPIQKDTISTLPETKTSEERHKKEDEIETLKTKPPSPKDESQSSDTPDSPETKKIGKLKTMNFSIDVSTLLPGASPKKKSTEQTDGQIISVKSQEDLHAKENVEESKTLVKSVSFEGEPDSQILDNKISKERAKIQVKRRPSTRRARKEAVRKSVLDLGEDSTDNSSSFDDAPKTEHRRSKNVTKRNEKKEQNANNIDNEIDQIVTTEHKAIKDNEIDVLNDRNESGTLLENENTNINIEKELNTNESEINTTKDTINNENSATVKTSEVETNKSESNSKEDTIESKTIVNVTKLNTPPIEKTLPKEDSKNVKSKVVYILNDEDIFNTPAERKENSKSITYEDDSLFKNPVKNEGPSISTIGNAYKEENSNKKSIFDDMSDEENELFNTNKKKTTKTKGILDSDSDDDLFFGKKEIQDKVSRVKETEDVKPKVNKSLFGDDDDDEDLFGAKVKVEQAPSAPVRSSTREVVVKPSQPVLDDPLSLLGNDDD